MYQQFDIEPAFQLVFEPGSHFLLFHCKDCIAVPPFPPKGRLPTRWLTPGFRSTYRLIMNRPGVTEAVHPRDSAMIEQRATFVRGAERVTRTSEGPIGVDKVKIGGLPTWRQLAEYPTCACGAPMGFVMQVPTDQSPGWQMRGLSGINFACGLSAYLFFCSVQSSPYAGVIICQR